MVRKNLKETIDRENEAIGNLKEQFISRNPNRQHHQRFSANEASGAISLGYYRGLAIGKEDGMNLMGELILKNHPELKKEVKEIFKNNRINTD